jgi:hypothetical protein
MYKLCEHFPPPSLLSQAISSVVAEFNQLAPCCFSYNEIARTAKQQVVHFGSHLNCIFLIDVLQCERKLLGVCTVALLLHLVT